MATLETLTVELTANTASMRSELQKLTATTQSATAKMGSSFDVVKFAARSFIATLSVRAISNFTSNIIESASRLKDLSDRIGFSASTLSALQLPLQQSGSSVEALTGAVARLNNALGEAAGGNETARLSFEKLGLSVDSLLAMTPEERFLAVADALGQIKDQAALAEAGQNLFGRGFAELIPLIKEANGSLSTYVDDMKKAGLTDAEIAKIDEMGDALDKAWYKAELAAAKALSNIIKYYDWMNKLVFDPQWDKPALRIEEPVDYSKQFSPIPKTYSQDTINSVMESAGISSSVKRAQSTIPGGFYKSTSSGKTAASSAITTKETRETTKAVKEQKAAYAELEKERRAQADAERERQFLMKQYAYSFESAFEDAIVSGKKLSSVLDDLGKDIMRTVLRTQITAPLTDAITSGVGSIFGGSGGSLFSSIFSSLPSFAVGTDYVPRDMIARVHKGEAIVPAGQNNGGGITVNVINNSSASVRTQQSATGNGTSLRVMIDEAVAANMARSGSRTSQAMGAYNSRALTRR